jgi:hypothetical protein
MASKNIKTKVEGEKLIVEIDVCTDTIAMAPSSASGKSKLIATTGSIHGIPIDLPDDTKLDLNITATIKNANSKQ